MNLIVIAVVLVVIVGVISGILLSFASKIFEVKEDQVFLDLRAALPGANCGGCGFAGCDDYAHALAENGGETPCTKCSVGGPDVAAQLASILGTDAGDMVKQAAMVLCQGTSEKCKPLYDYKDIGSCKAAKTLFGGSKACSFACLGQGDCVGVCEFDAIHVVDGVAKVNKDLCTACGQCVKECPQHIIMLKPVKNLVTVKCSNTEKGGDTRKACSIGCIGCMKCVKVCPKDAIHVENNLARIDVEKCINCGLCARDCPTGAIENERKMPPRKPAAPKTEAVKAPETKAETESAAPAAETETK